MWVFTSLLQHPFKKNSYVIVLSKSSCFDFIFTLTLLMQIFDPDYLFTISFAVQKHQLKRIVHAF